ncbi:MAG: ABC transporter ATP-binding protein [Planctomycetes bacterium]|nr:ABC transporter ATP-binding protein [Planctomycetota bacterium]
MTAAPLAFEAVRFAYGDAPVFTDLSFAIHPGEFAAILGPNGSGKTTLLRLATRVVRAAGGRILLGGEPLDGLPRREVARRAAVVPQEETRLFNYSVDEIVLMGRTPWVAGFGFEGGEDRRIARAALEAVEAEHLRGRPLGELSGGERQRVLLARALAQKAPLLLLDEPTAHLDLRHQVAVLRLLDGLRAREGLTVVLISHDVNLAARFAGRLLFLGEGRVVADGPPREVLTPDVLTRVYGAKVAAVDVPGLPAPFIYPE